MDHLAMWRLATRSEDNDIVEMSRELFAEDPAPIPVPARHARETLSVLRTEPTRGRAVVLQASDAIAGYALLISFWSNELGGEIIVIDELYVRPPFRNQRYGRALLADLIGDRTLWPRPVVAVELEVTPQNRRAAALYSRLGFESVKNARMRFLPSSPSPSNKRDAI